MDGRAAVSDIPRASVVSILRALLAADAEMARLSKSEMVREYYNGRVSGLRTSVEVLTMDENSPFQDDKPEATKDTRDNLDRS